MAEEKGAIEKMSVEEVIRRHHEVALRVNAEQRRAELRDRFAMAALTGLLSGPCDLAAYRESCAKLAFQIADAMLAAR